MDRKEKEGKRGRDIPMYIKQMQGETNTVIKRQRERGERERDGRE